VHVREGLNAARDVSHDDPHLAVYGARAAPPPRTLVDIFEATVAAHPDAVALEDPVESLTYQQLAVRVEASVRGLQGAGIRRGDRVGVRVPSGTADLYVAILATLRAGATYVPVDWDDPEERARTVFAEAGVASVIGEGLAIREGVTGASEAVRGADPGESERPGESDDAWIIFTSGSTGTPKGVAVTHRSAAALVDAESRLYLVDDPLRPGDRVMAGLSVAFDASCEEMWLAWRYGAALVAAPREVVRSGPDLGDWIVDRGITAVSTVPTLASLWPVEALERVRLLIFGGEACPLDLALRLHKPGRELWNTYGPTESTVIACGAELLPEPPVRIGRPICGWQLAVVDAETGWPVGWGESGELVVAGVGLGRYLDPQKDAEKYAPVPSLGWARAYWTGDLVTADPEGLVFAGRADDQVKLGGKRLELGEVDGLLMRVPGVNAAAAALQQTQTGISVLVGYLTQRPGDEIDLPRGSSLLADWLPNGVTPVLTIVDQLPMKTSGKVDRKALPWPLAQEAPDPQKGADAVGLDPAEAWLKQLWMDQLGPLPIASDTDFFQIGGGSVQAARLTSEIRKSHPAIEIGELYAHSTLAAMADYVGSTPSSESDASDRPMPEPLPTGPRMFQFAFVGGVYVLNATRYLVAVVAIVWALGAFAGAGWVPRVPFLPVLIGVLILFSVPGKMAQAAVVNRLLTHTIRPGVYRRGGWIHVRLWAAERFLYFLRLEPVCGTALARSFHRLMGNRIGRCSYVATMPPVGGLVTIGDKAAIEHEADLSGYWVEGDAVRVDTIGVADGARIGTRATLSPGVSVGAGAEVLPGAHVDRDIPGGQSWGGSPISYRSPAGASWPRQEQRGRHVDQFGGWWLAEAGGLLVITVLPLLALLPGIALVLPKVIGLQRFTAVAPLVAMWLPLVAVMTVVTWLGLVVVAVRLLARWITPGYFRQESAVGWATWMTQALLQRTLVSAYPVYASLATPVFLRLLGAHVGKNTEISTIETIPHLMRLGDQVFLADHALVTSTRHYRGQIHVGPTRIGEGSFVGNSAIVGPGVDLPAGVLLAALASAPEHAAAETSWLGRPAESIPRVKQCGEQARTYRPSARVRLARGAVELCRIVPFIITLWIELGLVVGLNAVYMPVLSASGSRLLGVGAAMAAAFPLTLTSGAVATIIAIAAKWALVGRFVPRRHALFSSFVWRNELADVFAESLAVPSLIRVSIGSPLFNTYARLMGAAIGKHVWCESWWLPEFDLIRLGDYATVNRGTVVQTHLFHDRVMSLSYTRMEAGSTLGANSFMLPGARIESRTVAGAASLVLRDESLPRDTYWQGNPARFEQPDRPRAERPAGYNARVNRSLIGRGRAGPGTGERPSHQRPSRRRRVPATGQSRHTADRSATSRWVSVSKLGRLHGHGTAPGTVREPLGGERVVDINAAATDTSRARSRHGLRGARSEPGPQAWREPTVPDIASSGEHATTGPRHSRGPVAPDRNSSAGEAS
jgi:non-ribosomal peptide synthetase-like protein